MYSGTSTTNISAVSTGTASFPKSPTTTAIMMRQTAAILLGLLGLSSGVLAEGAFAPVSIPRNPADSGKTCTLNPIGNDEDDVPQILEAFEACNNGGTVVFPEDSTFYIATKLNPVIYDVTIDWRGTWLVCLAHGFSDKDNLCKPGLGE